MRSEQEIIKLRTNILKQIDELELLISRKSEAIMQIDAPIVWSHLPYEINALRDNIKFLKKEINYFEGQIKIIDWMFEKNDKFYEY